MLKVIEAARDAGIVRPDSDAEILLDLMSGAIIHHLLVRPVKRTRSEMYLSFAGFRRNWPLTQC